MTCEDFDRWLDGLEGAGPEAEGPGMGEPGMDGREMNLSGTESLRPAALEHSSVCLRCRESLRAAREIEETLEAWSSAAPSGFADKVMRRIEAEASRAGVVPSRSGRPALVSGRWQKWVSATLPLPWWAHAFFQPTILFALLLGGVLIWAGPASLDKIQNLVLHLGPALANTGSALESGYANWQGSLPSVYATLLWKILLGLGAIPLVLWISWLLYKWPRSAMEKMRG